MIKFYITFLYIFLILGCAAIFGPDELIFPKEPQENCIKVQDVKYSINENIIIKIGYLGPSQPLITARNLFGGIMRYVVPYTKGTALFEITVQNNFSVPVVINTEDIILETLPDSNKQSLLNLEFFKAAWPTSAVSNDIVMLDRAMAMSYVIRTIFSSTTILPDNKIKKIIPFMKWDKNVKEVKISIKNILIDNQSKEAVFQFKCGDEK